eukprot:TRINITY_DN4268_c0_g1_i1.p1 TRINITY_DN4268_c0_g1~~TRINITY_DN4268_c0_g1_i1.p1  ORF type:complete len:897 (+),score=98.87 TRINITY_DN4268_c0_g1_i1:56-2746(+)
MATMLGPVTVDGYTFRANFDSGNLARVERAPGSFPPHFHLWIASDAGQEGENTNRTWFHFAVSGGRRGDRPTFHVMNLNSQVKLFSCDMRPVVRVVPSQPQWRRVSQRVTYTCPKGSSTLSLHIPYTIEAENEEVFFAFTYPYSYEHLQERIHSWSGHPNVMATPPLSNASQSICFGRELLCKSIEGRRVDVLTITSWTGASAEYEQLLEAPRNATSSGRRTTDRSHHRLHRFPGKPYFVVSARVHAGEVPASHVLDGLITFLLGDDPRAIAARNQFVFKLIPMLNPDGVVRGHYRTDTRGVNLNRCFVDPDPALHPAIYHMKNLLVGCHKSGKLALYLDLHGHATKRGCFMYGNCMETDELQARNLLFPKLVALNTPYFDFGACNFSEQNMRAKDKRDGGLSKEGTGRVRLFVETGLVHSYTLECNYNCGVIVNRLPPSPGGYNYPASDPEVFLRRSLTPDGRPTTPVPAEALLRLPSPYTDGTVVKYCPETYADVGRALVIAALDMHECNPCSRLPSSSLKNLQGVKMWLYRHLRETGFSVGSPSKTRSPSASNKASRSRSMSPAPVRGAQPHEGRSPSREAPRSRGRTPPPPPPATGQSQPTPRRQQQRLPQPRMEDLAALEAAAAEWKRVAAALKAMPKREVEGQPLTAALRLCLDGVGLVLNGCKPSVDDVKQMLRDSGWLARARQTPATSLARLSSVAIADLEAIVSHPRLPPPASTPAQSIPGVSTLAEWVRGALRYALCARLCPGLGSPAKAVPETKPSQGRSVAPQPAGNESRKPTPPRQQPRYQVSVESRTTSPPPYRPPSSGDYISPRVAPRAVSPRPRASATALSTNVTKLSPRRNTSAGVQRAGSPPPKGRPMSPPAKSTDASKFPPYSLLRCPSPSSPPQGR